MPSSRSNPPPKTPHLHDFLTDAPEARKLTLRSLLESGSESDARSYHVDTLHEAKARAKETHKKESALRTKQQQGQSVGATPPQPNDDGDVTFYPMMAPSAWETVFTVGVVSVSAQTHVIDNSFPFVYHAGEEIAIPLDGVLRYTMFGGYSPDGNPIVHETAPVRPREIIRINPSVPHRARAEKGELEAFVCIRHSSNTPLALGHLFIAAQKRSLGHRTITYGELADSPEAFALISWGLAEKIDRQLQRANLQAKVFAESFKEVLEADNLGESQLSQLMRGHPCSPSLADLAKLASFLRFDLRNYFDLDLWYSDIAAWEDSVTPRGMTQPLLPKPKNSRAYLHPHILRLEAKQTALWQGMSETLSRPFATWIVRTGAVRVAFHTDTEGGVEKELERGGVLHLRDESALSAMAITAREGSELILIAYSRAQHPRFFDTDQFFFRA